MQDPRPRCSTLAYYFGRLILLLTGWRVEGDAPMTKNMLVIAAPHTSNWDAVLLIGAAITSMFLVFAAPKDQLAG
jgi:1-acyl-sn-glycerol-3-phosphate acyltransferase